MHLICGELHIITLTFLQSFYGVHCNPDHFAILRSTLDVESVAQALPVLVVAPALGGAAAVVAAGAVVVVVAAAAVVGSCFELDAAGHIEYAASSVHSAAVPA